MTERERVKNGTLKISVPFIFGDHLKFNTYGILFVSF
jgi:ethanolamine transporter EutH